MKQLVVLALHAIQVVLAAKIAYDLCRLATGLWRVCHGRDPE